MMGKKKQAMMKRGGSVKKAVKKRGGGMMKKDPMAMAMGGKAPRKAMAMGLMNERWLPRKKLSRKEAKMMKKKKAKKIDANLRFNS